MYIIYPTQPRTLHESIKRIKYIYTSPAPASHAGLPRAFGILRVSTEECTACLENQVGMTQVDSG